MAFFTRHIQTDEPLVIEHGDELDVETRVLLVKSLDLLHRTQAEWHRRGIDIDMTLRMQLRQDCREMETAIRAVDSRMCTPKKVAKLENMYLRLKAEAEVVLDIKD